MIEDHLPDDRHGLEQPDELVHVGRRDLSGEAGAPCTSMAWSRQRMAASAARNLAMLLCSPASVPESYPAPSWRVISRAASRPILASANGCASPWSGPDRHLPYLALARVRDRFVERIAAHAIADCGNDHPLRQSRRSGLWGSHRRWSHSLQRSPRTASSRTSLSTAATKPPNRIAQSPPPFRRKILRRRSAGWSSISRPPCDMSKRRDSWGVDDPAVTVAGRERRAAVALRRSYFLPRQARSNGNRQERGAISGWTALGPHESMS